MFFVFAKGGVGNECWRVSAAEAWGCVGSERLEILPGVASAVRRVGEAGERAIAGVGRVGQGVFTFETIGHSGLATFAGGAGGL